MIFTRVHELSAQQLCDIETLQQQCKQVDGAAIPIYKHLIEKRHPLACNVLCYENEKLLGFLRSYFFFTDACEITLMVSPEYRKRGIASQLLREIEPILQNEKIVSLIFSTPANQHKAWLTSLQFTYRNSEFQMQYDYLKTNSIQYKASTIRRAHFDDVPALCALDQCCFPNKTLNQETLFQSLLYTPNCDLFVLIEDQKIIGKAHVFTEYNKVRLTDIGVLPEARGKGYGSALIKHCINHALMRNKVKIFLDVEANNSTAIELYKKLGFVIINSHDYWVTPQNAPHFGLSFLTQPSLP